jgi:hypothetical protein
MNGGAPADAAQELDALATSRERGRSVVAVSRLVWAFALGAVTLTLTVAQAQGQQQFPMADRLADRVIANYQSSSCEQLAAKRATPPSAMQQRAVQFMRQDPTLRAHFIDRVAGPIANKLFECGLIP